MSRRISTAQRLAGVALSYFFFAYLVHGAGYDITRRLLGGGDGFTAGLPSKVFGTTFSMWDPYVQLGHYTFSNTQFQALYPPGLIIMAAFPNTLGYNLFILCHYALAGLFFYLFARNAGLTRYAAYTGGICFMSCGFVLAHKGHQAMMSTAVWLPLMLLFVDRYARSRSLREAALGGFALGLSILGGFPQVTLYAAILMFAYLGYRCLALPGQLLAFRIRMYLAGFAVVCVTGLLLSSLQLLAVADSLPHSTREKISLELFNQDSLPVFHFALLWIPNLFGNLYGTPNYSNAYNFVEVYPYVGLLPLIFALFAVRKLWRMSGDALFWTLAVASCSVLALGLAPVQSILYHVPVYNLFRAPARHLYEVTFGICVLAAYGVDALLAPEFSWSESRGLKRTMVAAASLFALILAISQLLRHFVSYLSKPEYARFKAYLANPLHSFAALQPQIYANLAPDHATVLYPVILFTASVVVFWRLSAGRVNWIWKAAVPALILLDVWIPYRTLYRNPDTSKLMDTKFQPELDFIMKRGFDRAHYRIYPTDLQTQHEYPLLNLMYGLSAINDYSPMWSKRYQSVAQFALNGESPTAWFEPKLLDTLGVQYIITHHQGVAQQLRRVAEPSDDNVSGERRPALNCSVVQCYGAQSAGPGTISLASSDGSGVGIVQIPMTFTPSTVYQIAFDARADADTSTVLTVDLYFDGGKWPLGAAQSHPVALLGSTFARRVLLIDSGRAPAPSGYLRLITTSKSPVEIRNLSIGIAPSFVKSYRELYGSPEGYIVFENPGALPRFRFASELLPAKNLAEARAAMLAPTFDPARQAVVEGLQSLAMVEGGKIISERIGNDSMAWRVETAGRSFFVVADSWFPGWLARVDGRETPIQIVNGFLRGVFVDSAGRHTIEMEFRPSALKYGLLATLAGLLLVAGSWLVPAMR